MALHLVCGYQGYEWGKPGNTSRVADLVGDRDPSKRYAELWVGTHPSKPAVLHSDKTRALKTLLESDASLLGASHVERFGSDVPFLLKVLSIDKALSIQAHPEKSHAEQLHAADPKNYPDANHKPELVIALTPFQALCCFRPIGEIKAHLTGSVPQLKQILSTASFDGVVNANSSTSEKAALRAALSDLYGADAQLVGDLIDDRAAALANQQSLPLADRVFLRIQKEFPRDVGCWMVYFLNVVEMNPGDGLFMAPNEPHSYLQGDCVEIMASSDNVVRAGLTPKFKDVHVLLQMLTYRTDALEGVSYTAAASPLQTYSPAAWCNEFSITAVRLHANANPSVHVKLPSASLAVVVSGTVTVAGATYAKGSTFFVPVELATQGFDVVTASDEPVQVFFGTTQ